VIHVTTLQHNNGDETLQNESAQTHAAHPHGDDVSAAKPRPPHERRRAGRRAWLMLAIVGVGAAAAATAGTLPRLGASKALHETTQHIDQARRSVTVVSPSPAKNAAEVRLPGSTSALQETTIYARTSGYIASLSADIGDRVKAGQLLATITSPEVDQELLEARARLEEGRANLALAATRLKRFKDMHSTSVATDQEVDDAQAVYNTQQAALKVSEAVVSRLETEQSYQKVVAPFDGVVTRRNIDQGSLITAGSGATVTSLFELQQQGTLKVFIDVPQSWAASVATGATATVELREFPDEQFRAEVVRTSGSLDPSTRTLRTELHLPNADGRLFPGMYAQVKLSVTGAHRPLIVPANTLVVDAAGVGVVTVDGQSRLQRQPVRLGRDFGREVEVVSGLAANARLVASPRDDLRDGETVTVVQPTIPAVASR
jgi:membrane fusion protein, multidrug efflux system